MNFMMHGWSALTGESRTYRATVTRSRFCVTVREYWQGSELTAMYRHFTLRPVQAEQKIARGMEGHGWVRLTACGYPPPIGDRPPVRGGTP